MNDNNLPEEDSENTNLPVLLRDDTICGVDGIVRIRREGIVRMAQHCACSLKSAMILLLRRHNICPRGSTAMLVCSTPGKWHACLKAGCSSQRLGIGALRLCDPDVFEESHLNRQCFCTEQTLSRPKVLACRDGLLGMASYM